MLEAYRNAKTDEEKEAVLVSLSENLDALEQVVKAAIMLREVLESCLSNPKNGKRFPYTDETEELIAMAWKLA